MAKGPMVRVKWPDGHVTNMLEADAIERGLLRKARPQAANKMAPAAPNKAAVPPPDDITPSGPPDPEQDDFTTIPGIGLGTARSLAARDIKTYDQLRAADDLTFLGKRAIAAIETWKNA